MTTISQRTFSSGEISPSLYARTDLTKYATGLRTCKNNIVLRYGGAANRPGTEFICEVSDSSAAVRLIPFIFNTAQTYMLEFGNLYMRVIKDGVLQKEAAKTITGVTQNNPGVVTTSASHGYSNGDEVYISDVVGMSQLNGRNFKVNNVTSTTFELQDMSGTDLNTSGYDAYSSGGSSEKIYEIVTPYTTAQVQQLNYVQSADIVTIAHPSHPPAELARTGDTSWTLTDIEFTPDIAAPTAVSSTVGAAGSNTYEYVVTSIDEESGEESLVGTTSTTFSISAVSQADPCQVTVTGHSFAVDDIIAIDGVVGMTELNGRRFTVTATATNTIDLDVDSTDYTAYSSAGTAYKCNYTITSAAAPTTTNPNVVSWTEATGAIEYNVYRRLNGVFGLIGIAQGSSFNDEGLITPDTTETPPPSRTPFVGTDNYPSTVTYIQQRLGFANTNNDTEKIFLSRTANFKNFTYSSPIQDDDAVTFKMAGRQVNAVKAMVDLGRLVVLTTGGEWSAAGDSAGVLSPTAINTKQYSYNGSGDLAPIIIDGAAIYQQARGSIIRDLGYDFQVDGYSGNDLTIFNAHLFDKYTLNDWTYQQIPHSILWVARSDGTLLGMTFVRNQQVIAWHRHEIGGSGFVENVATIPDGNEDSLYMVVKRTINGATKRYIEKLSSRQINLIEDSKFMDSYNSWDGRNTGSTTMTLSGGTDWLYTETLTLTASASYFNSADVGNAIHLTGASGDIIRATITAYSSATVVSVTPHKTVPTELRNTAVTTWTKAITAITGLWHLEGEEVSVFGDGFVVASPNNVSYDTLTVANGSVTLDKNYGVVHVGLPYLSDIETLDIDTSRGETLADKSKNVGEVTLFVEDSRGIWIGPKPPSDDTTDPLENLVEMKIRNNEDYDSPVSLKTDSISVNIKPEWNSNGRVFIRQVDPIPMTILSINPAGKFPFRG